MERVPQPSDGDELSITLGWLAFHRDALQAKGAGLDADASMLDESMAAWEREKRLADERIAQHETLDSIGAGNGHSVRWNVQKLIGEYARHNGHADLIRERIDGQTGE